MWRLSFRLSFISRYSFRLRLLGKAGVTLGFVAASSGHLGAVTLKPTTFPLKAMGVELGVPVTISFDMNTESDSVSLRFSAEASLKDLQDKALVIAKALPVPRGNCDRDGINPVVNSVDDASIVPDGDTAVVAIKGHVTAWVCAKRVGFKTEGAQDSVAITAPVRLTMIDGKQLGLTLAGPVKVEAGSNLTNEAVRLFSGDIEAGISRALTNALNADQARASLPTLPGMDGTFTDAAFAANAGTLLARAHGNARMTSDAFNALLDSINK